MPDRPRITALAVEQFEVLMDERRRFRADGVWTPDEERLYEAQEDEVYGLLMRSDEALGIGVTLLRCGPESPSLKRRMMERGLRVVPSDTTNAA